MARRKNTVEWEYGIKEAKATIQFGNKYFDKFDELVEKYPDLVKVDVAENGEWEATFPAKWIRIQAPRQMSEEQRQAAAERLEKARSKNS